jgi:hypothetical protein
LTFEIAIQLGLVGVAVLYAMWAAQLKLFMAADCRLGRAGLVVQDMVSSLFLSHMFDFTTGWICSASVCSAAWCCVASRSPGA